MPDADPSVLDRLESAYAAYAESRYLATPTAQTTAHAKNFAMQRKKEHKLTGDARRDTNLCAQLPERALHLHQ